MHQPIRKKFNVPTKFGGSVEVEELVFYNIEDDKSRLVWTRFPFDEVVAGGLPNPCIHIDWPTANGPQSEEQSREQVKKAFIEYYRL